MIIRIDYPQPSVRLDLWGGTSGTFDGIDRFGRIIDQRWQNNTNTTPLDIDRYEYGYDQDGNRLWKQNTVGSGFDESYTYDALNQLTQMQRGTLNSGHTAVTGTPAKQQSWTLDPLGNWNDFSTQTSGYTDLSQTRTHDKDNQITGFSSTPAWATPPGYDAAGNMTSFPKSDSPANAFTTTYDAWNRMKTVSDADGPMATYQYDGFGRRTIKTTAIETRHFYFTSSWQDIEERVGTAATADLQYMLGQRYIDELICRDDSSGNRLFVCQDANFNLTCIADTSGTVQERYVYHPYGSKAIYSPTWQLRSTSSCNFEIGFQGIFTDPTTDLSFFRSRQYSSGLGIFLSRDSAHSSPNLYDFCLRNPIKNVDPSGNNSIPSSLWPLIALLGEEAVLTLLAALGAAALAALAAYGLLYLLRFIRCSKSLANCINNGLKQAKDCVESGTNRDLSTLSKIGCQLTNQIKFNASCEGAYAACMATWFGYFEQPEFDINDCVMCEELDEFPDDLNKIPPCKPKEF